MSRRHILRPGRTLRALVVSLLVGCLGMGAWAAEVRTRSSCEQDPVLREQAYDFSAQVGRQILTEFPEVPVPWRVQFALQRLVQASALSLSRPVVHIRGYGFASLAAQAMARHTLLVSEGTWSESSGLSEDEIAAVLAHELAHLEQDDMLRWGCFALSLDVRRHSLPDAIRAALTALDEDTPAARRSSAFLHGLESAADQRAKQLLQAAGYSSDSLATLLTRMASGDAATYPTHPSALSRVHRLR